MPRRPEIADAIIASIKANRYRTGKQLETELPFRHSHIYRELKGMLADGKLVMNGPCYYSTDMDDYTGLAEYGVPPDTQPELPSEDVDLSDLDLYGDTVRSADCGQRVLIIPDAHFPFQSTDAWRLMMSAARWYRPDVLVVLGDFIDCYSVSSYPKSPGRLLSLKNEVDSANIGLDDLDSLGCSVKMFFEGNHERRLATLIADRCPALFDMFDFESLLKLKERGYSVTPYMQHARLGKVNVTHGIRQVGEFAHTKARQEYNGNVIHGHTHWMGLNYRGDAQGEAHFGASMGWLGDVDKIDYAHKQEALRWQLGFGVGRLCEDGMLFLQPVPIVKNRCCVDGRIFSLE